MQENGKSANKSVVALLIYRFILIACPWMRNVGNVAWVTYRIVYQLLIGYMFVYRENHEQEKQSLNSIAENTVAMEVT